jgi:cell division septum initiation protein DivIVA
MEILGLLDHLESIVLDSAKIPFSKKIMVDEDKLLTVIDKIRMVLQGGSDYAKKAIGKSDEPAAGLTIEAAEAERRPPHEAKSVEIMEQAYKMAKEIREGADKYADEVLANLEATSTRILRTVKAGRERLEKTTQAVSEK